MIDNYLLLALRDGERKELVNLFNRVFRVVSGIDDFIFYDLGGVRRRFQPNCHALCGALTSIFPEQFEHKHGFGISLKLSTEEDGTEIWKLTRVLHSWLVWCRNPRIVFDVKPINSNTATMVTLDEGSIGFAIEAPYTERDLENLGGDTAATIAAMKVFMAKWGC